MPMKAIEWWPTAVNKHGRLYPRVFIAGGCGWCGNQTVSEGNPRDGRTAIYCTKSHAAHARARRNQEGRAEQPAQPRPWRDGEEFDAYIEGGFPALIEHQRRTASERAVATMDDGARQYRRNIARGIRARLNDGRAEEARDLLARQPRERWDAILTEVGELAAGTGRKLTTLLPEDEQFSHRVANYYKWRVLASKILQPPLQEQRRRASCTRPDKVSFEDTELGRAAAEHHLDRTQKDTHVETLSVYRCVCGDLHIGNTAK